MYPRVKKVVAKSDYKLCIEFNNGKKKIFDMKPYLNFGIFRELKNINYFKKVKSFMGTVVWPHGQDICPDTIYLKSNSQTRTT